MTRERFAKRAARAAGEAVTDLENRVLAAEGRRSIKAKVRAAGKVAGKAIKAGLIAGGVVATVVVRREVGKRRKLDR